MDSVILKSFIPETFLSLCILSQLLFNSRLINNLVFNFPVIDKEVISQTAFVLICTGLLFFNLQLEGFLSTFLFINDGGGRLVKIFLISLSLLVLSSVFISFRVQKLNYFEYFSVLLLAILSLLLLISCNDLMSFYLIIEMQSLCFYVLASFKRDSVFSTEAGLKYFISGAFMSGFLLLGSSIIYGCLGTLNFHHLTVLFSASWDCCNTEMVSFIKVGIIFITATLLFKLACAPFHFWSPDVYEGSPLSSTIIFSILPKFSLFFFFMRWINCVQVFFQDLNFILLVIGVISSIFGTLFAISQKRIKRLFIYSSISQVGFLVAGMSYGNLSGISSMFFYLIVYLFSSVVIWGQFGALYQFRVSLTSFSNKIMQPIYISSLSGLSWISGAWGLSFIIGLFSIAGIPPLLGFLSKVSVLLAVIGGGDIWAGQILILISSISAFYYIRILKVLLFEPNQLLGHGLVKSMYSIFNAEFGVLYLIHAITFFLLIFLFYCPNILILSCQYVYLFSTGS